MTQPIEQLYGRFFAFAGYVIGANEKYWNRLQKNLSLRAIQSCYCSMLHKLFPKNCF